MSGLMPCNCPACEALRAEVGDEELFGLYSKKLLLRGWGGSLSPAERAYVRAHRPQSERQRAHMRELAEYRFKRRPQAA